MYELPHSAPKKRRIHLVVMIVLLVVGSLLFFGGFSAALGTGESLVVRSRAMENTLRIGQRIQVDRTSSVQRGDIVAVRAPEWRRGPGHRLYLYLWRVIGTGGDRVVCCDSQGRVTVNGKALDEDYIPAGPGATSQTPPAGPQYSITVPPGRLWVMGDNRALAYDSRYRTKNTGGGTLAADNVHGRVFAVGTKGIGTPAPFTRNGLADDRSSLTTPVLGLLAGALGLLVLIVTTTTALIRLLLSRRQHRPRPPSPQPTPPGGSVPK